MPRQRAEWLETPPVDHDAHTPGAAAETIGLLPASLPVHVVIDENRILGVTQAMASFGARSHADVLGDRGWSGLPHYELFT